MSDKAEFEGKTAVGSGCEDRVAWARETKDPLAAVILAQVWESEGRESEGRESLKEFLNGRLKKSLKDRLRLPIYTQWMVSAESGRCGEMRNT